MWEWYKNTLIGKLPPLLQLIIWIIVGFGIYRASRWIYRQWTTRGQKQELSDNSTNINNLQQQGLKPSYSASQYSTWANQLQEAFDGCGTSNGVWENIFPKIKNDLDVALLIDSYGVRTFDECNLELDFGDFKGSLSEALIHELSASEIEEINKSLQSNQVNYRF